MGTTRYVRGQARERLTPEQFERRRILGAVVRDLQAAREREEPWYMWIARGMPKVSEAEWERTRPTRQTHGKAADSYVAVAPPQSEPVSAPLW